MNFLFPNFLFFLSALVIPIIIHLFNFRRYKKIAFTNVHLLRDIEIKSKSVKQLKNYLILACRILALSFLVFAFAQPFLLASSHLAKENDTALLIYIDNSFSMEAGKSTNSLLNQVKTNVLRIVESLNNSTSLYVLTNDFKQSELNKLTKSEALDYISEINVSHYTRDFSEIGNRIEVVLNEADNGSVQSYIFSDFQKTQFPSFNLKIDSSINLSLIKVEGNKRANISIDSCWLSFNGSILSGTDSLYVSMHNYSNDVLENHPVRMHINDQQVSLSSVSLKPWEEKIIVKAVEINQSGYFNCRISTTDDGIDEDDELFFTLTKDSSVNIYHLGDAKEERYFNAVYKGTGEFRSANPKNADIEFINLANTFIVNGQTNLSSGLINEIKNKVNEGANLILYSVDSSEMASLNSILDVFNLEELRAFSNEALEISKINTSASILKSAIEKMPENPIFPSTKGHYKLEAKSMLAKEDLLSFENGDVALRRYEVNQGNVFLYSFPLSTEFSNYKRHPLFVALSLNTALYQRTGTTLFYTLGENNMIPIDQSKITSEVIHVKSNETDIIPESKQLGNKSFIMLHEQVRKSGNYLLFNELNKIGAFSMNYPRSESDPRVYNSDELSELISLKGGQFKLNDQSISEISASSLIGKPSQFLWKYCIILALMFFLTETIIIKFMKT